ncbi:DNA replication complex GINS family protein [Caldivirga sp.]|uniref:DNA replication complex GINS family protein n=1 Tax=Caldivirga sp. TaxID=2080243 RepID=UPI0025BE404A|nr:DNA replication complex GINS family protein [Caldivirga sp.]
MPSVLSVISTAVAGQGIKVIVNRDIPKVEVNGISFGGYSTGDLVTLPVPLVERLIRRRYVSLTQQDLVTIDDVRRIHWTEGKETELTKLDKLFYVKARLSALSNGQGNSRELMIALRDLVSIRLKKVLNMMSVSPSGLPQEIMDKLTIEEELLVKELTRVINPWFNMVISNE